MHASRDNLCLSIRALLENPKGIYNSLKCIKPWGHQLNGERERENKAKTGCSCLSRLHEIEQKGAADVVNLNSSNKCGKP